MPNDRGRQIFDLQQYLAEARRLHEQGEIVEAIWCYETVLRDPSATRALPTLRQAAIELSVLLISEIPRSDDSTRKLRLADRAVTVLCRAAKQGEIDTALRLALAEAHAARYELLDQPQDVLSANLLLDELAQAKETLPQPLQAQLDSLRIRLARR